MASTSEEPNAAPAAASSTSADGQRTSRDDIWAQLNAGHDPAVTVKRGQHTFARTPAAQLEGVTCDDGEHRCYVLTEKEHLSVFLPTTVTRDRLNSLLITWELLKLMPPAFYVIVFALSKQPGQYRAVPDSKLLLDGYPQASRAADDAERVAGFTDAKALRLVLYPNAIRFLIADLHAPLRAEGAWPTTRQVQTDGYLLTELVRTELGSKLDAIAPAGATGMWATTLRAALHRRHWPPAAPTAAVPPPAAPPPLPVGEQPRERRRLYSFLVDQFPTHASKPASFARIVERVRDEISKAPTPAALNYRALLRGTTSSFAGPSCIMASLSHLLRSVLPPDVSALQTNIDGGTSYMPPHIDDLMYAALVYLARTSYALGRCRSCYRGPSCEDRCDADAGQCRTCTRWTTIMPKQPEWLSSPLQEWWMGDPDSPSWHYLAQNRISNDLDSLEARWPDLSTHATVPMGLDAVLDGFPTHAADAPALLAVVSRLGRELNALPDSIAKDYHATLRIVSHPPDCHLDPSIATAFAELLLWDELLSELPDLNVLPDYVRLPFEAAGALVLKMVPQLKRVCRNQLEEPIEESRMYDENDDPTDPGNHYTVLVANGRVWNVAHGEEFGEDELYYPRESANSVWDDIWCGRKWMPDTLEAEAWELMMQPPHPPPSPLDETMPPCGGYAYDAGPPKFESVCFRSANVARDRSVRRYHPYH